jgi:hypothetical protein
VQLIFEVLGYNSSADLGFSVSAEAISFLDKRCRFKKQHLSNVLPGVSAAAQELLEVGDV